MRFNTALRYLVFFLPFLVVLFAVLMGAAAIARMAGDGFAEAMMNSAGVAVAILLVVNAILLTGVLGMKSLVDHEERERFIRRRRKWGKHMRRRGRRKGRHRERSGPDCE